MEKFKKIDSQTAEVTTTKTVTETQTIKMSDLINDRDSLIRTKNMETTEFNDRIKNIDEKIQEHNLRIKQLTDIGIKALVLAPEISTVEEVKVDEVKILEEAVEEKVVVDEIKIEESVDQEFVSEDSKKDLETTN